jgi:hypothetical protein
MRKALLLYLFLLHGAALYGAFETKPISARGAALGGLCSVPPRDCWSLFGSPVAASALSSAGFSFSPGLFGFPDLMVVGASALHSFGRWGLGCSAMGFGGDLYREMKLSPAIGYQLSESASAGLAIDLYHLHIRNYGAATSAGLSLGATFQMSEGLEVSMSATNVTGTTIGGCEEKLPRQLALGLACIPASGLVVAVEGHKEDGMPASLALASEYCLLSSFLLRVGISNEMTGLTAGAGVVAGNIQIDYGCQWHRELGLTHVVSITLGNQR